MTDLTKGLEYMTEALAIYADYPDAHMNRGCTYSVHGNNYLAIGNKAAADADHAAAKKDYEAYIAIKQDNPSVYNWLGLEFAYIGDWDGAIRNYSQAITINPDANKGEYYYNRAVAKRSKGDASAAADAGVAKQKGWPAAF